MISGPQRVGQAGLLLFASGIFASAFLIFAVQPMVGKHILPWFGGVPSVWMVCLAFYQTALFAGYSYAYLLIATVPRRLQPWIHGSVFAVALIGLPVLPGDAWKPDAFANAGAFILLMLIANVALPFGLLASTGPLVQAWFARAFPARSPYPLYAVSNLGSLLALLSYPFLVEPRMGVSLQSRVWSAAFFACGLAVLCCAWWASRPGIVSSDRVDTLELQPSEGPSALRVGFWILFPASAVVMLMGVTNHLCLDVASIPFLWILPLCVYLLTLVFCFTSERLYRRALFMPLSLLLLALLVGPIDWNAGPELWRTLSSAVSAQVLLYSGALFCGCMVAHGELHRLRPAPSRLTAFYLCVAGGGALGGLFAGIAAPLIFSGYYELAVGVVGCWMLALVALALDPPLCLRGNWRRFVGVAATVLSLGVFALYGQRIALPEPATRALHRGFFGILRVVEGGHRVRDPWLILRSGTTNHGMQFRHGKSRLQPTYYYGALTGVGLVMGDEERGARPRKVGVIGLGIGTLAAYGRRDDQIVFYEIDPEVVRLARDAGFFTFLESSEAQTEVVVGDARLALESELNEEGGRHFDVLVVDAFSSDAIPVHLLTREAIRLYQLHLRGDGVLVIHVSNRHLNLAPLVFRMVESAGMHGMVFENEAVPERRSEMSRWAIFSRDSTYLVGLARLATERGRNASGEALIAAGRPTTESIASAPIWTDDYSNLFSVMK